MSLFDSFIEKYNNSINYMLTLIKIVFSLINVSSDWRDFHVMVIGWSLLCLFGSEIC